MRAMRSLAAGAALLALLPGIAAAQGHRNFENSWFWGVKGGSVALWTTNTRGYAPLIGGETLITRSRGGLYISLDQAFLGEMRHSEFVTTVPDPVYGKHRVEIGDLRRVTVQAMGFPVVWGTARGNLRPYFGVGVALNFIQESTPLDGFVGSGHEYDVETLIDEWSTRAAPIFTLGAQLQLLRFSIFGQGSYMPAQSDFLFNGNETYFLEAGMRYNIGSSRERID